MNEYAFLPFCAFLTSTFILFFGIAKGIRSRTQKTYTRFVLSLSLWSFFDFINWNWTDLNHDWVMFIYHIQAPAYLLLGVFFMQFVFSIIDKKPNLFSNHFIWVAIIFSAIGLFTPYITANYEPVWWGVVHIPGPLFIPAALICCVFPTQYAIIILHKSLKHCTHKNQRKQRLQILIGTYFVLYISLLFAILLPHVFGVGDAMQLSASTVTVLAVFMHIAITKYDLLPISVQDSIDELFQHSMQGVLIIDREKIIIEMNPAASSLLQMNNKNLLNTPVQELIEEDIFESDLHECEIEKGSEKTKVYINVCANKHIRNKNLIGWVLILQDITDKKLTHEKVTVMNLTLEERVKKRTLELEKSKAKLIKQTEDLEKISTYKSEFMANMSHEIRTPMNGIMGFTQIMLLEGKITDSQLDALNNIQNCSNSLLDLVNDILDFSKIEADCIAIEKIYIDLGSMMSEAAEMCSIKLDQKNKVELLLDVTDLENLVLADPTRLKQVVVNLIGNAVKFTHKGHILVKAKITEQNEDKLKIKISISDTGIGITEDQQKIIFNPFEQADGSTTRKYGGTGLGLSISKRLVELMGGKLEVSSEIGQGTEFYFSLTLTKGRKLKRLTYPKPGHKFIHIENCKISRDIFKKSLRLKENDITEKSTTLDSIKEINEGNCQTLVVNTSFLDDEHCELLKAHLKAMKKKPQIIAISPSKAIAHRRAIEELNADFHISKPYNHQKLLNTLFTPPASKAIVELQLNTALNILMVEDNPVNQKLQKKILTNLGHRVEVAKDGLQGLQKGMNPEFDLILMDMQLPELNGLEVTEKLRQENIKTPIIALTANAFESDKVNCLNAGMNGFLTKPVQLKILKAELHKFANKTDSV